MKKLMIGIFATIFTMPSYAEPTDQLIFLSLNTSPVNIQEVTQVDEDLLVTRVSDHELRVMRKHFKSGNYVVTTAIDADICKITFKAASLGESIESYDCSLPTTIELDRKGTSSTYYVKVAAR